jgi:hypothetical protein
MLKKWLAGLLLLVAYYAMQRQRDGSWRTNGCHLVPPVRNYPAVNRIPPSGTIPA